jgi:hypothetical protein
MKFRINGLEFGGDSKYKVLAPVVGLDSASVRTAAGDFSGRDGGYVSAQFYGSRTIVINGFYRGTSCEDADSLREELAKALKIRVLTPIYIETFSKKQYLAEAYLLSYKSDITGPFSGTYQITYLAVDPFLYDAGDGADPFTGYLQALFYKTTAGGYDLPYNLPVLWATGTTSTPITNEGSVAVFPEIILENAYHNPVITNLTTGKFMELNMTTIAGDKVIIDMKNREITKNGVSVAGYRTVDSNWWTLEPGINLISLETTDVADKNWGLIRWRQGYEGI